MQDTVSRLKGAKITHILRIQSAALKAIHDYMYEREVVQAMPVILSPETDPLNHPHFDASVEYYGQRLHLTKSMILHKQLSLLNGGFSKVYVMSPNVRLEEGDLGKTGRHLFEFTQVDIELKEKSKQDFMELVDGMIAKVFSFVIQECEDDLKALGRDLRAPTLPLKVYESEDLRKKYGDKFEAIASTEARDPFWVTNFRREFYDREDKQQRGYYHNYDVFWPEGFGEALSGGERERKTNMDSYTTYLDMARQGLIPSTVGGGLGIERLVRYLTGQKHVRDVALFPRVPGERIAF
jgi:asparaginyl-tRNA synthetase